MIRSCSRAFGVLSLIACLLCSLMATSAQASFQKSLWPIWEINNPLSRKVISHDLWQQFLNRRVIRNHEGINLVDYPNLKPEDLQLLSQYVTQMASIDIDDYNRDEQLAYWINLYNALTVQLVAGYYPISSVQEINISPGLFSIGPWGATLITVKGVRLSLDEIHNRIIRPIWNDPRTHYAINNATIGAANLQGQAFTGARINEQLNQSAAEYINSMRGVQVIDGQLVVSKIYEWFAEDFGEDAQDIIQHLRQFAGPELLEKLKTIQSIHSYTYNWHINSTIASQP